MNEDLVDALDRDEFFPEFQPVVSVPSRQVVGAEILARWRHPELGTLQPDRFIPQAEEEGAISDLGLRMLRAGWRAAEDWNTPSAAVGVSVNVSAAQLVTSDLYDEVARLLEHSSLTGRMLTLEITESLAIEHIDAVAVRLRALRELGVGISVDDFGVGFSTRERIEQLPVTELKIDISMTQDESDAGYAALLETAEYAHERGIQVVAEGVETEEQFRRVELLRCQRAQGFLFGRPVPAKEFLHLVRPGARRNG